MRNVASTAPVTASSRTRFWRAPAVKLPATSTLPTLALNDGSVFASTATANTVPTVSGERKVPSSEPSALSRATRRRGVPLTLAKLPPMTTLPRLAERTGLLLMSTATALTVPSAPVSGVFRKAVSRVPSALRRSTRARATPL